MGTIESVAQSCNTKDLAGSLSIFDVPVDLHDLTEGAKVVLPYYCSEELCNVEAPIKAEIETKEKMAALLAANPKGADGGDNPADDAEIGTMGTNPVAGAAQTTVAVATIAFSMVMARLAL